MEEMELGGAEIEITIKPTEELNHIEQLSEDGEDSLVYR